MKYVIYILFLIINFGLNAQDLKNGEAIIEFTKNEFDFGTIQEDQKMIIHSFEFINSGTAPLLIYDVTSACECVNAAYTQLPISPGSKGYIKVQFAPLNRNGIFNETIQIKSNSRTPDVSLIIEGVVNQGTEKVKLSYKVGELSVKSKHINLGYIKKGEIKEQSLPIANYTKKTLKLDLQNIPEYIDAEVLPAELLPGESGTINIKFNSEKMNDWDYVIDRISVVINGKSDNNSKLAVTSNIREDFSCMTVEQLDSAPKASFISNIYSFDTIPDVQIIAKKYILKNDGLTDLVIRAVKPSCGCTAVKPNKNSLAPGDSAIIEVVFNPKGRIGEFDKPVTVITNDPKNYKQFLWIKGYVE